MLVSALLAAVMRSEEHTSELQSLAYLVCRLLLEKNTNSTSTPTPPPTRHRRAPAPRPRAPLAGGALSMCGLACAVRVARSAVAFVFLKSARPPGAPRAPPTGLSLG